MTDAPALLTALLVGTPPLVFAIGIGAWILLELVSTAPSDSAVSTSAPVSGHAIACEIDRLHREARHAEDMLERHAHQVLAEIRHTQQAARYPRGFGHST